MCVFRANFPSLFRSQLRFQSLYKCLIDCIRLKIYSKNRVGAQLDAKLNFYWISITYTYSQASHGTGMEKKRHKNPSHKRWSILNYYRGIQNVLCTCVNQLYALLIARCTKLTPQRTYICTGLICNQKLMKITLQPHFLLLKIVSFLRDNFDVSFLFFMFNCGNNLKRLENVFQQNEISVTFTQTKSSRLQKHPIS